MHKPTVDAGPTPETLARGYEVGDVSMKTAVIFTAALTIFLAGSFLAMSILWHLLTNTPPGADDTRSIVMDGQLDQVYAPLQPTQEHNRRPYEDMTVMRNANNDVFREMGWAVDPETGYARVPDSLVASVASKAVAGRTAGGSMGGAPAAPKTPVVTPVAGQDEGAAK